MVSAGIDDEAYHRAVRRFPSHPNVATSFRHRLTLLYRRPVVQLSRQDQRRHRHNPGNATAVGVEGHGGTECVGVRFGECGVLLCIPQRSHSSLRKAEYRNPTAVDEVLFRQKIKCAGRIKLLIRSRGAVSRNLPWPEAIDGQYHVAPEETQPIRPEHGEIIKTAAAMENNDGRRWTCLRPERAREIAEQLERACASGGRVELYKLPGNQPRGSDC